MKNTVRLDIELPREYYSLLKKLCNRKGLTLNNLICDVLIKELEDFQLVELAVDRLANMKDKDLVDFEEATRLVGWDDSNDSKED